MYCLMSSVRQCLYIDGAWARVGASSVSLLAKRGTVRNCVHVLSLHVICHIVRHCPLYYILNRTSNYNLVAVVVNIHFILVIWEFAREDQV